MTKQQYIDYWINSSAEDWLTVEAMFSTLRTLSGLLRQNQQGLYENIYHRAIE
jgi:hypothetical protein